MSLIAGPGITLGAGITITPTATSFTIGPSDFTHYNWGSYITPQGNTGFITDNSSVGPGWAFYSPILSLNNGGSITKLNEIRAYWALKGLNANSNSYMFNVTWNPDGSTVSSGVAILELFDYGDNNAQLNIGAVDTSNPIWQTSGTNYYEGPPQVLVGTFNLPATFTLIEPIIVNNNNWC